MGQALYRKYRPKKLTEVVGQDHITTTLQNALNKGKISHAYLFTGPRGVGKTSIARIWAHEINSLPYDEQSAQHIDIIEIDAASNRRIDEIRELRDRVYIAPTSSQYKVYIIDEVHMLTKEAFNALLKTLEEPPSHAVFILATTDSQKIPDTIISRTQKFVFKPLSVQSLSERLTEIAKNEKITVDSDAIGQIAKLGHGSFRDSISLLDQLSNSSKNLSYEHVVEMIGVPSDTAIDKIIGHLWSGIPPSQLMQDLNSLYLKGYRAELIAEHLIDNLRNKYLNKQLNVQQSIQLINDLIDVSASTKPDILLEIILIKHSSHVELKDHTQVKTESKPVNNSSPEQDQNINIVDDEEKNKEKSKTDNKENRDTSKNSIEITDNKSVYDQLLTELKKRYNTLYSIVRMANHDYTEKTLTLSFEFPFHYKKISEESSIKIISEILNQITGTKNKIQCKQISKKHSTNKTSAPVKDNDKIKGISNIFGGAELLES